AADLPTNSPTATVRPHPPHSLCTRVGARPRAQAVRWVGSDRGGGRVGGQVSGGLRAGGGGAPGKGGGLGAAVSGRNPRRAVSGPQKRDAGPHRGGVAKRYGVMRSTARTATWIGAAFGSAAANSAAAARTASCRVRSTVVG